MAKGQLRWIECDESYCDDKYEEDGFISPDGMCAWDVLESAAREDGWTCSPEFGHFCPAHSNIEAFAE